jgi:hypothetical protein
MYKKKITTRILFLSAAFVFCSITVPAQEEQNDLDFYQFARQQRKAFEQFVNKTENDFRSYRDSVNREFASFLETQWKIVDTKKQDPPIKKPIPVPPAYIPGQPKPKPGKIPLIPVPAVPPPPPEEPSLPVEHVPDPPASPYPVRADFFGTEIGLAGYDKHVKHLSGVTEKDVAAYWTVLSNLPHHEWTGEISRITQQLSLNDWGIYQIIGKMFEIYVPSGNDNERTVFSIFMLNQLGYRAKIGRNGSDLVPLLAFRNTIFNTPYFREGDNGEIKYWAINPARRDLPSIQTCAIDYPGANRTMDFRLSTVPKLDVEKIVKTLSNRKRDCTITFNRNLVDFYASIPCVDFHVYAETPLDKLTQESFERELPDLRGKSQEEAVDLLLSIVQHGFKYKTDDELYGYERWYFAEETIASAFSDCDDRAILFTQLVRNLLGMKAVLIHYPNVHLAAAVRFDNQQAQGDFVTVDGENYLICDPTYINATYGMSMPNLKSTPVEIIKLRE